MDGVWSAYSAIRWSGVCSTTCGPGTEAGRSTRKCNNPAPAHGGKACGGLSYRLSQRPCKLTECPSKKYRWVVALYNISVPVESLVK